jgi:hypothetical protein
MKPAQVLLRDVASVALGITLRGADASRHNPAGTHQLIRIGDVSHDGVLRIGEPNLILLDAETAGRSALQSSEVLVAARGSRTTAAVFDAQCPAVAGGQFLVIRPQVGRLLPIYLRWFLNLPSTQNHLIPQGSYMRSVTAATLAELNIPLPPLPQQHAIAALHEMRLHEKHLMESLAARRAVLIDQSILLSFQA